MGIKIAVATLIDPSEVPLFLYVEFVVFDNVCDRGTSGSSSGCGASSLSKDGSLCHGSIGTKRSGFVNVGLGGLS